MDIELQNLLKASEFPWDAQEFKELLAKHSNDEVETGAEPACETERPLPRELNADQVRLLSAVELELRVEVSRLFLSIEEVLDLSPGKVLVHADALSAPVILRLGESAIAEGRFVRQDGRLALQIISVLSSAEG